MRSPEHKIAQPRAGKRYEDELHLRYMSPGAFTVLPPGNHTPDPPSAPEPYRLTPSTKRHKNTSFAIIGEVDSSRGNSRSPSPTGRVSPFRGSGFNPSGSRFAISNDTPPPPEDARLTPTNMSPRHISKIPKLKRKDSPSTFGESISHFDSSQANRKLQNKLSQSLTNLESKKMSGRPPPSPRKNVYSSRTPAFQRLSPISGSSPEPIQSLSSPSRIPKSQSTPTSRRASPTRNSSLAHKPPVIRNSSRTLSRTQSTSHSRNQSRNSSRDSSPTKDLSSPIRVPAKYRNIQAKVNSFNKPKPKVPPKPQATSGSQLEEPDVTKNVKTKPNISRKGSTGALQTNLKSKLAGRTQNSGNQNNNTVNTNSSSSVLIKNSHKDTINMSNSNNHNNNNNNSILNKTNSTTINKIGREKVEENRVQQQSPKKDDRRNNHQSVNETTKHNKDSSSPIRNNTVKYHRNNSGDTYDVQEITDGDNEQTRAGHRRIQKTDSSAKLVDVSPSTMADVSNTTTTLTQSMNINSLKHIDRSKAVSPMVDGRVLSATSVSNAMNKMNDSVLNTQTVIKDHAFSRPSSNAVISASNGSTQVNNGTVNSVNTKHGSKPFSKVEPNVSNKTTSLKHSEKSHLDDSRINSDQNRVTGVDFNRTTTNTNYNRTSNSGEDRVINTDFSKSVHGNYNRTASTDKLRTSNPSLDIKNPTTAFRGEPVSHKPGNMSNMDTRNNEIGNNHTNCLNQSNIISSKAQETEVHKSMSRLISPEHVTGKAIPKSVNDRIKEARTLVAADVQPIRINVKEKPSMVDVQSGNIRQPMNLSNGLGERPSLPSHQSTQNDPTAEPQGKNACSRFFSCCKCCRKELRPQFEDDAPLEEERGCFSFCKRKTDERVRVSIDDESDKRTKLWDKLNCCNKHKVSDTTCFSTGKRKDTWMEHREGLSSKQQESTDRSRCSKGSCKSFLRKVFCINLCCRPKVTEDSIHRKASILSKKKSLTPTPAPPPEDTGSRIDTSLVEPTSHMKGAIPVLPVCLAWFCLVMNCIAPGTGTFLSGLLCLCIGKPRFSQKDGARQRIGSFIINTFIGFGQFFTVLFCLVGWGWSIWWGVIMVKMAKKHKKLKLLEEREDENLRPSPGNQNQHSRDPVRNV